MRFPDAYKGTKKILIGQIMVLIAAVFGLAMSSLSFVPEIQEEGSWAMVVAAILLVLTAIITIVGFIMELVGVRQGGNDSSYYAVAFWIIIITIVLSIITSIFQASLKENHPVVYAIFEVLSDVAMVLVTVYVLCGIARLAEKLSIRKMASTGRGLALFVTLLYIGATTLSTIPNFAKNPSEAFAATFDTLSFVASVLTLVISVLVFIYLIFAVKMLKKH